MDWHELPPYSGIVASILGVLLTWLNRQWFIKMLVPKMVLVAQNQLLQQSNFNLRQVNSSLIAQAEGWRGAAEAAGYLRIEADDLRQRVSHIEVDITTERQAKARLQEKVSAAIQHIHALYAFIAATSAASKSVGLPPPLPAVLEEGPP